MENTHHNRQLILVKKPIPEHKFKNWNSVQIGEYVCLSHPNLDITTYQNQDRNFMLAGFMLDYKNPEKTNLQILTDLSTNTSSEGLIKDTYKYFGQFVIIYHTANEFILFGDGGSQKELYYNQDLTCIGSQPKLLGHFTSLKEDDTPEARAFYSSKEFLSRKVFPGELTQYDNIKRLKPNHLLNINNATQERFFPSIKIKVQRSGNIAKEIADRLIGCSLALKNRYNPVFHVSGGWDSRVLLALAIKVDIPCSVFRGPNLNDSHYDVKIPRTILSNAGKDLDVRDYDFNPENNQTFTSILEASVDFARTDKLTLAYIFKGLKMFEQSMVVTGHMGEVGRNFYDQFIKLNGLFLARMTGYGELKYALNYYQQWLDENKKLYQQNGYNTLDMFYWEERIGSWGAKGKTERNLVCDYFSIFNSRELLELMLSTKRKDRDSHLGKLFPEIVKAIYPDVLGLPVNPDKKQKVIRLMKKTMIYPIYREIFLRLNKLQF